MIHAVAVDGSREVAAKLRTVRVIFDEPTNHVDLWTKEALVKALAAFEGTMLFVSRDRYLLKRPATKVLDLPGNAEGMARVPRVHHGTDQEWVEKAEHEAPGAHC